MITGLFMTITPTPPLDTSNDTKQLLAMILTGLLIYREGFSAGPSSRVAAYACDLVEALDEEFTARDWQGSNNEPKT